MVSNHGTLVAYRIAKREHLEAGEEMSKQNIQAAIGVVGAYVTGVVLAILTLLVRQAMGL
jgi:hypothetical protein